ncbi:nuclear transport factor 2 family protein [Streptomyces sp. NPDC058335]|uniref:nuclear transport factor 2 family protein n=1 Tax=Streptomyces sp. NPDC058335 TaxID=3346451 RepID=UPI0036648B04
MMAIQRTPTKTVRSLFTAIDDGNFVSEIDTLVAEDVYFRFGSTEPQSTKAALVGTMEAVGGAIDGIRHDINALWEPEPGTVVVTCDVHYRRSDGRELTLPCCNVFRVRDGLVHDYRIYMDINPALAP